ncbi:MAG: cation:proton antiporter [Acidimicrobiales bacterium]
MVLGLAFLLAGSLARLGRRAGLPTIPLFMLAGIIVGPNTPGPVLFEHPEDLELLAAFGLIFLLFYLGVEFSVEDLTGGGRKLLATAGTYLGPQHRRGARHGLRLRLGHQGRRSSSPAPRASRRRRS